ncbi:PadR family transcriptional regulator [Bacillus sp. FJAT-42376]|uniref:PadR family transcriptional regulator n=1 Tax=Bacillus sp. FJAT-42376 TaxID=2014076 RepID=UPI000F4EE0E6|nr:helix-turn-helix transcriptional regulator [Bacillus sp. FJAT-42376]AZB40921.1 PadR family transcriptional regulator [Bacillus sp. FJAT-42376]
MTVKKAESFLPLTHTTYFILLALFSPLHGYGIMKAVEEMSEGTVKLGPGTLYGALGKLEKQQLIEKYGNSLLDQKKNYRLTKLGKETVRLEYIRLETVTRISRKVLNSLEGVDYDEKSL